MGTIGHGLFPLGGKPHQLHHTNEVHNLIVSLKCAPSLPHTCNCKAPILQDESQRIYYPRVLARALSRISLSRLRLVCAWITKHDNVARYNWQYEHGNWVYPLMGDGADWDVAGGAAQIHAGQPSHPAGALRLFPLTYAYTSRSITMCVCLGALTPRSVSRVQVIRLGPPDVRLSRWTENSDVAHTLLQRILVVNMIYLPYDKDRDLYHPICEEPCCLEVFVGVSCE